MGIYTRVYLRSAYHVLIFFLRRWPIVTHSRLSFAVILSSALIITWTIWWLGNLDLRITPNKYRSSAVCGSQSGEPPNKSLMVHCNSLAMRGSISAGGQVGCDMDSHAPHARIDTPHSRANWACLILAFTRSRFRFSENAILSLLGALVFFNE